MLIPRFPFVLLTPQHAPRVVGIYPETKHPTWHDTLIKARKGKTTITDQVRYLRSCGVILGLVRPRRCDCTRRAALPHCLCFGRAAP